MEVHQKGNEIEIKFKYNPYLLSIVKGLFSRRYVPQTKSWFIPLAGAEQSLDALKKAGFKIDPQLFFALDEDKQKNKEAELIASKNDIEFVSSLPLYNFQRVGAAFLDKIGSGILGDEPGGGKTLQVMALAEKNKAKKVLVFCPAVLKHQWEGEIHKFLPGSPVVVIEGNKKERSDLWSTESVYYIANYELLLRDFEQMDKEWDYIFADEATKISSHNSKQSKLIKKLRSKHRIAMTGTPISNTAQNCWSLMEFCNPGCMGNYFNFINRYCIKNHWGSISSYQNLEQLRIELKKYMIRRLKKDILPELPDRMEIDIPFVLSDEEKSLQKKIKQELLFEIDKMDISKLDKPMTIQYTIVKFLRLRQLADSMELLGENAKSSKLEVLKELLEELITSDKQIIIFSELSEMCKILNRELCMYSPLMIIGETSDVKRQEIVRQFNNGESKILILSSAGQFGLNLQASDTIINYDLPLSIAKFEQRIGRAHRIGQKNSVMVYSLLGKGTADMAIKRIIYAKRKLSDDLLGELPIGMQDIKDMLEEQEEPY